MYSDGHFIELMRRYSGELVPGGLAPYPTDMRTRGALHRPVKAVLFDVYGTLFVSGSGDIGAASERVRPEQLGGLLDSYGVVLAPDLVIRRFFDEIRRVHAEEMEKGIDFPEIQIDAVWMAVLGIKDRKTARCFACEYEMTVNPVWPMPGLDTLLAGIRDRRIVMGIVSNAQFFTPLHFELFLGKGLPGLGFSEDVVIFSFREGRAKPSLQLFETAAKALDAFGVARNSTLYVGNDMLNDILPAGRAGFQTVLFAGDRRSLRLRENDMSLRGVTPDLVVTNLGELSEHIGKG